MLHGCHMVYWTGLFLYTECCLQILAIKNRGTVLVAPLFLVNPSSLLCKINPKVSPAIQTT